MDKDINRQFKEGMQIANRDENVLKISNHQGNTVRFQFTPIRMKHTDVDKRNPGTLLVVGKFVQLWKTVYVGSLKNSKIELSHEPATLFLCINLK